MASATRAGRPRIRVMPAACIATSVPVAIAMPTSAAASAGASLMPSPTMATTWPPWRRRPMSSALCCGSTSACTVWMPKAWATAWALPRLSPDTSTVWMPSACRRLMAAWASAFSVSPNASRPSSCGTCSSLRSASQDTLRPSSCSAWACSASGLRSTRSSVM